MPARSPRADSTVEVLCELCDPPRVLGSIAAADAHRRWMHPTPVEIEGEEAGPPQRFSFYGLWWNRMVTLASRPNVWRRWPYRQRSSAQRAARAGNDRAVAFTALGDDVGAFIFQAHEVEDRWWVYGINLSKEHNEA